MIKKIIAACFIIYAASTGVSFAAMEQLVDIDYDTPGGSNPMQITGVGRNEVFDRFEIKKSTGGSLLMIMEYSEYPTGWWINNTGQWTTNGYGHDEGGGVYAWYASDFPEAITLRDDRYYLFMFYQSTLANMKGTDQEIFGMEFFDVGGNTEWQKYEHPLKNAYFKINDGDQVIAPVVSLVYPVDNTTYQNDVSHWQVIFDAGSEGVSGTFGVRFGSAADTMVYDDEELTGVSYSPNYIAGRYITKSAPIEGITYAQAYIKNIAGVDIATSTVVGFSISTNDPGYTYTGGGTQGQTDIITSTSTDIVLTCDKYDALFSNSLCKLGIYLFQPSDDVLNRYSGLWGTISKKPPMGYFTESSEAIEGIANSTSSAIVFEDMSELDGIFDQLKNGVAWLLWAMFGFWIFHRISNLQL